MRTGRFLFGSKVCVAMNERALAPHILDIMFAQNIGQRCARLGEGTGGGLLAA